MKATRYSIADEPAPGRLAQYAVDPMWPLFGMMFGGAWFGWAWAVFNGYAVGSPTRVKESIVAAVGVGTLQGSGVRYALIAVAVWKVGVSYVLYFIQNRTFEIYEYYGGVVRNGVIGVVVAALAHGYVLQLSPHPMWKLIVG